MLRTIKLLIYYIAYTMGASSVATGAYMLAHGTRSLPGLDAPGYLTYMLLGQLMGTLAITVHLVAGRYVCLRPDGHARPTTFRLLAACVVLMLALSLWTNYLNEQLGLPDRLRDLFAALLRHPLGLLTTVIAAPVCEEIIFRGAILGHLLRTWQRPWAAVGVSALVFGAIHGNPAQMFFAFLIGLVLGWVYLRTGSLVPGIVMHFVNNALATLIGLASPAPDYTMADMLGSRGALACAVLGLTVSLAAAWYVYRLTSRPCAPDAQIPVPESKSPDK